MPDNTGRDPAVVASTLESWLTTKLPEGAAPRVDGVTIPESNGFSNETVLFDAEWSAEGSRSTHPLVLRVAPTRNTLFFEADFAKQYRVMRAVAAAGAAVPLPGLHWYEETPSWFDAPFFLMDRIDGVVPADNPPYSMGGWLLDASVAEQARMWRSGVDTLAALHTIPLSTVGTAWFDATIGAAALDDGLSRELTYYRRYLDWTLRGRDHALLARIWEWLVSHRPASTSPPVLCWGDARIGNIIWDGFEAAAVLDWEMATIAPPELDLGWWLYFDRQLTEALTMPRVPGFASHDETVAMYEAATGSSVRDVEWYEIFSGFRFAVIMYRLVDLLIDSGQLPADTDMGTNNLATQFTEQLIWG